MSRIGFLLVLIHFYSYSQTNIDNSKIEQYCFELHNELRDSSGLRTVNLQCKKAADYQVDYLFANNLISHDNKTKGYEQAEDRFSKFTLETVKVKDRENPKTIHTHPKYQFEGEIATWSKGLEFKNDSSLELNIANEIISSFKKSQGHFQIINRTTCCDFKQVGYFSTRVRILDYNNSSEMLTLEIYCIAVFGTEYYYRDFYVYNPKTGKFED
jgi:hypothetical protein